MSNDSLILFITQLTWHSTVGKQKARTNFKADINKHAERKAN